MQPLLYLAGPIKGKSYEDAIKWREEVSKRLTPLGIVCLSPMRWRHELHGTQNIGDDYKDNVMLTQKGIVARDRFDVQRCDALLVNFLGATVCNAGTPIEYGWANAWNKPIVSVIEPAGNSFDHAFIRELTHYRVERLEEGIEIARKLLLPEVPS